MENVITYKSFAKTYTDLEVYKRAYAVSLAVHKASLLFPEIEQYALGDQIRRASKSICANIAEGFAKQSASTAEFKRFLQFAIGSGTEMQVWIQYCSDLGYIDKATMQSWHEEYDHICRMLQHLYQKSRASA